MNNIEAIHWLQGEIGCIQLDESNGRPILRNEQNFIDACNCAIEAMKRNEPVAVRVETYEYRANKYFCPICGKQQKQSYKNFDKGCFCERCGQKLLPLRS